MTWASSFSKCSPQITPIQNSLDSIRSASGWFSSRTRLSCSSKGLVPSFDRERDRILVFCREMSVENRTRSSEEDARKEDENILQFLDSMDGYLTLFDSLSSTLRQGWLELASARHSMGTSRITSALFDLKLHSAATTLQVNLPYDESASGDPTVNQPHFTLSKWASLSDRKYDSGEVEIDEELQKKSYNSQLRHRGPSTDVQEKDSETNGKTLAVDDQIQKERSKSLSVFGTLVSPKLRSAQVSFETALETLVKMANMRSSMLSAYAQIRQEMEGAE